MLSRRRNGIDDAEAADYHFLQMSVLPDFPPDVSPRRGIVTETRCESTTMVLAAHVLPVKPTASGVSVQTEHDKLGVVSPYPEQNGLDFDYVGHDDAKNNYVLK